MNICTMKRDKIMNFLQIVSFIEGQKLRGALKLTDTF